MVLLEKAGFGKATGITFKSGVCSGMVIFFVKSGLDQEILNGAAHICYLRRSAQFIGTAVAMTEPRRATLGHKLSKRAQNITSYRNTIDGENMPPDGHGGGTRHRSLAKKNPRDKPPPGTPCCEFVPKRIQLLSSKF